MRARFTALLLLPFFFLSPAHAAPTKQMLLENIERLHLAQRERLAEFIQLTYRGNLSPAQVVKAFKLAPGTNVPAAFQVKNPAGYMPAQRFGTSVAIIDPTGKFRVIGVKAVLPQVRLTLDDRDIAIPFDAKKQDWIRELLTETPANSSKTAAANWSDWFVPRAEAGSWLSNILWAGAGAAAYSYVTRGNSGDVTIIQDNSAVAGALAANARSNAYVARAIQDMAYANASLSVSIDDLNKTQRALLGIQEKMASVQFPLAEIELAERLEKGSSAASKKLGQATREMAEGDAEKLVAPAYADLLTKVQGLFASSGHRPTLSCADRKDKATYATSVTSINGEEIRLSRQMLSDGTDAFEFNWGDMKFSEYEIMPTTANRFHPSKSLTKSQRLCFDGKCQNWENPDLGKQADATPSKIVFAEIFSKGFRGNAKIEDVSFEKSKQSLADFRAKHIEKFKYKNFRLENDYQEFSQIAQDLKVFSHLANTYTRWSGKGTQEKFKQEHGCGGRFSPEVGYQSKGGERVFVPEVGLAAATTKSRYFNEEVLPKAFDSKLGAIPEAVKTLKAMGTSGKAWQDYFRQFKDDCTEMLTYAMRSLPSEKYQKILDTDWTQKFARYEELRGKLQSVADKELELRTSREIRDVQERTYQAAGFERFLEGWSRTYDQIKQSYEELVKLRNENPRDPRLSAMAASVLNDMKSFHTNYNADLRSRNQSFRTEDFALPEFPEFTDAINDLVMGLRPTLDFAKAVSDFEAYTTCCLSGYCAGQMRRFIADQRTLNEMSEPAHKKGN